MCRFVKGPLVFVCAFVVMVQSRPAAEELMTLSSEDTAVVESTVREVRQAVPSHIGDLLQPGT